MQPVSQELVIVELISYGRGSNHQSMIWEFISDTKILVTVGQLTNKP